MSFRKLRANAGEHESDPESFGANERERKSSLERRDRADSYEDSKSKSQRDFESDPRKTLFIGRLNPETTEDTLHKQFEKYGNIKSLFLIRDIITGDSRRYAFCEYRRSKEADKAYAEAHNLIIDGRRILVDREFGRTMKGWKPRRLGGGFGGTKESGQIRFGGRHNGSNGEHHEYRARQPHNINNNHNRNHGYIQYHSRDHPYSNNHRRNEFNDSLRSRMHGNNISTYRPTHGPIRSTNRRQ